MANKENELGALWKREMRNDSKEEYYGGNIKVTKELAKKWVEAGEVKLTVFNNKYHTEGSNQPFLRIYESTQRNNNQQQKVQVVKESVEETEECEELL
tara:strand:+ start:767 stop:1060 length:294 start_codon:yes stop_codon:yes gene_type:complete